MLLITVFIAAMEIFSQTYLFGFFKGKMWIEVVFLCGYPSSFVIAECFVPSLRGRRGSTTLTLPS